MLNQVNTAFVTLFSGKWSVQEGFYDFDCKARAYNASSHRQYVGIVVQAGCLCAEAVGAECCTDSFHFVCRDRNADSGSADQDSLITRSVLDRMAYFSGVNRIINCLVAVASEVLIFQSLFSRYAFTSCISSYPPWSHPKAIIVLPPLSAAQEHLQSGIPALHNIFRIR